MVDSAREQSEFNMAVSYLNRLNGLFYAADEAAVSLDVHSWYHILMALTRELSTEMNEKEGDKIDKQIKLIHPLIQTNMRNNSRTGRKEVEEELYHNLHQLEILVRGVLKSAGLQNKMMKDPRMAL